MLSSKKLLVFLFSILALLTAFLNVPKAGCAVSSFSWLKPGSYAVYVFTNATFGFDDHALARFVCGNYSWSCLDRNATHAVLRVNVSMGVLGSTDHVDYVGMEYLEKAAVGDFSFIKRVPMDQVVGRVELDNDTESQWYAVVIPSPVLITDSFQIVVDLDTMMMIGNDGKPWGKWGLWIDPLKYPLEGMTAEPFVMNWLNTTVTANVTYRSDHSPIDTALGETTRCFAVGSNILHKEYSLGLGSSVVELVITYYYESRSGLFLRPGAFSYLDDILSQKFGLIWPRLWPVKNEATGFYDILFYLNETNVSLEGLSEPSGTNLTPYLLYLAVPIPVVAVAYLAYRRKKQKKGHRPD